MSQEAEHQPELEEETDSAVNTETEQSAMPVKPRRLWKWLRRSLHVLAYASLVLVLAYFIVGPDVIRRVLISQIQQAGIQGVDIGEADLRFGSLHLRGLVGREGRLTAQSVKLNFDADSLQSSEVRQIEIYGLRWQLIVRGGIVDLGLPPGILDRPAGDATDSNEPPGKLPFNEIKLVESVLLLDYEGVNLRVPVSGVIRRDDEGLLDLDIELIPMNVPMRLTGKIDPQTGAVNLGLKPGELIDPDRKDLAGVWAKALSAVELDFEAGFEIKDGQQLVNARLAYQPALLQLPVGGRVVTFEEPVVTFDFEMVNQDIQEANLVIEAGRASWEGRSLLQPRIRLTGNHERTDVLIEAGEPGQLDLSLTGVMPAPSKFMANPLKWEMPFQWRVYGALPESWASYIKYQGWQVVGAIPVESLGNGVLQVDLESKVAADESVEQVPWKISWKQLGIDLSAIDLKHEYRNWTLKGINASLQLQGEMGPGGMEMGLKEAMQLNLQGVVDGKAEPDMHVVSRLQDITPALSLNVLPAGAQLITNWGLDEMLLTLPEVLVEAPVGDWLVMGHQASGVEAEITTSMFWDGRALLATGTRGDLKMESLVMKFGTFEATYDKPSLKLKTNEPISFDVKQETLTADFGLLWDQPRMLWPDWEIKGESMQWDGRLALKAGHPFKLISLVQLNEAEIHAKTLGMTFKGVSISAPMMQGHPVEDTGSIYVDEIARGEVVYPPIFGDFYWKDMVMYAEAFTRLSENIELQADTVMDLNHGFAMTLNMKVPQTEIDDKAMLRTLLPELKGFGLTGNLALEGSLKIKNDEIQPYLKLDIKEGALVNVKEKTELEGIEGQLVINGLNPLTTPGRQSFKLARASYGGFELVNGSLRFRLEDWNRVEVERTKWDLPHGGKVFIHSFQFDVQDPVIDVELFVERMDLVKWLQEASGEMVSGSAKMNGRIPLKFKDGQVELSGAGFLYSTPGEGVLRVNDQKLLSLLMGYITVALKQVKYGEMVAERVEAAMQNLELTRMVIELDEQTKGGRASIWVSGKGTKAPFQEIGQLRINVTPIQDTIDEIMKLNLKRQQIDGALDDLFKNLALE